jgi:hypothetical protein
LPTVVLVPWCGTTTTPSAIRTPLLRKTFYVSKTWGGVEEKREPAALVRPMSLAIGGGLPNGLVWLPQTLGAGNPDSRTAESVAHNIAHTGYVPVL